MQQNNYVKTNKQTNKQTRALITKLITLRNWLANLKTVGQFDRLETQGRADVAAQVQMQYFFFFLIFFSNFILFLNFT